MTTCVGLRYGYLYTIPASFSRQCASWKFVTIVSLYLSIRVFPLPRLSSSTVSHMLFQYIDSAGIFCLLSISYAFRPHLRSRLTLADEPSPGNLRLSMAWILTTLSLLIPAFSLLSRPAVFSVYLRPTIECSSTTYMLNI